MYTRYRNIAAVTESRTYTAGEDNSINGCGSSWWTLWPVVSATQIYTHGGKEMWDNVTPNFKARKARGEILPTQPMRSIERAAPDIIIVQSVRRDNHTCNCTVDTGSYYREELWTYPFGHLPTPPPEIITTGQALKSAIADAKSGMDLGTLFGEKRETANYIGGRFRDIALTTKRHQRALANIAKTAAGYAGTKKQRIRSQKDVSSAWLEYRYAIMPIVYSIKDALKVLSEGRIIRSYGHFRRTNQARSREVVATAWWPDNTIRYQLSRETTVRIQIHSAALAQAEVYALSTNITINPLLTAWELLRLSFVVDWFIDIGDTLASFDMPWDANIRDLSETITTTTTTEYKLDVAASGYFTVYTGCGDTQSLTEEFTLLGETLGTQKEKVRTRRSVSEASIVPRIDVNLSWKRLLDSLALIRVMR